MRPAEYGYTAEARGTTFAKIERAGGLVKVHAMQHRFVALNGTTRYEAWTNVEVRCNKRGLGNEGYYSVQRSAIVVKRVVNRSRAIFVMPVLQASCNRGDTYLQSYVTSAIGREDMGGPATRIRALTEFAF